MTEFERLRSGQWANTMDLSILKPMARAYMLTRRFNKTSLFNQPKRARLLKKLFASIDGEPYHVQSPLHVEYGKNVYIGKNFLANYHLVIQDGAPIHIGDNVLIASNMTITTILHSMDAEKRIVQWVPQRFPKNHKGLYVKALPITIGNNVWICSNVTICPGVTIGNNTVIGAGSVVTKDIPSGVLAYGVPCRVIRQITEADRVRAGGSHDAEFEIVSALGL